MSTAADFLALAEGIAREAGEMLLAKRPARPEVLATKSSPTDVVTALDRASEELIRARIKEVRPDDAVLGEEGGVTGEGRVRWVVDPIDGTVNFLYGVPEWAVSIAVEVDGEIVAGVVNVVPRGEVFTAARGGGAWLAGERLRCNGGVPLEQALIATGFGYEPGRRAVQAEVLAHVLPRVRDIRRSGSAASDLCALAAGRVDGYYERGPQEWDYAAGGLIATEAGARLGGLHGKPCNPGLTLCAAPGLFEELHDLLAPLDPERDA
ncbi:inositol monophosphatase family protein [Planomonospora parontospora]|uniref:inositol monophosphatase family protein n=1 Tax=Planomonospora parontospora TaxID=58119 RepID=UPI0016710893|nr:inositol monophosphatase family protein [Planomonospora parontospora]GGL26836.1 inositol monophosphatase [Planomonospora parontospora subsp. antibiotica]GII16147.1 inositol monophosphatase [Planomonospora parontospora subsp. antibiotica]